MKGSQELFNVIAEGKGCYDSLVQAGRMTRKQYYPRLAKLIQLDLVKKGKKIRTNTFWKRNLRRLKSYSL